MKKKLLPLILVLLSSAFSFGQGFKIVGTDLKDANGNTFIMKGINIPVAWFPTQMNSNIASIRDVTGSNCVRIVVDTTTSDIVWHTAVEKSIENHMIPMVELHSVTGSNDTTKLHEMAKWWAAKAAYLTRPDISRYILINIANEWSDWFLASPTNDPPSSLWRDAYKRCIQTLRNAGIKTTLVIDAAAYGQDNKTNVLLKYGTEVFNSDPEKNILFSIHMYCEWAKNGNSDVATHLPAVKNAGLPVIVGEFGLKHATDGTCDIDEQLIMNTCQLNSIGWLAWSWKGNNAEISFLDLSETWNGDTLSPWGMTVVNGQNGTKTSVTASVFGNSDNKYPTVTLTAPENNSGLPSASPVTITAEANDSDGTISKVEFYNGSHLLNTDIEAPYTYSWTDAPDGLYTLIATAYDNENGVGFSSSVKIRIGKEPVLPNNLTNGEFDNGTAGWAVQNTGTAKGTIAVVSTAGMSGNNALKICSTDPGSANWHIQITTSAPIVSGKKYEISFMAKADAERGFGLGLQQNGDPWTTHYGQSMELTTSTQTFSYTFESDATDETAQLKFFTGLENACVYLDKVILREVPQITAIDESEKSTSSEVFPNPFENSVKINNTKNDSEKMVVKLINFKGEKVFEKAGVVSNESIVFPENISSGMYMLILINGNEQQVKKIEKK